VAQFEATYTLYPYLARFGRRLRVRDGWLTAQRTLWIACLGALVMQLTGRVWPIPSLSLWTLLPPAGWLLAVLLFSALRPLPPARVARRCDAELGLKERLGTAWAFGHPPDSLERLPHRGMGSPARPDSLERLPHRGMGSPARPDSLERLPHRGMGSPARPDSLERLSHRATLLELQQQDALAVAREVDPHRDLPLRWQHRPILIAALLAAATVVALLVPNPMDAILAERAAIAQEAERQAGRVEALREEVQAAQELRPEEREELLRRLEELARRLRANPGDREQALADFSELEQSLRRRLDENADARQAALSALAVQLQELARGEEGERADPGDMQDTLDELAQKLSEMSETERQAAARALSQMAARAAQSGDADLARALAAMAQTAAAGDEQTARSAARDAADAMAQAQGELDRQAALRRVLSKLQEGRQSMAQAGQGQSAQAGAGQGGQGQSQGQGAQSGAGQGQGQGQGPPPSGGGGTKADVLPPGTGTGRADRPTGPGGSADVGQLDRQVYVPWERRPGTGQEVTLPGQDTGQGEIETRERTDPRPGTPGQALVPYHEVYYEYLDAANQAMEQSYIPASLKEYVRDYFSRLEP